MTTPAAPLATLHRSNNFDFIRFVAASLVLLSHSYAVTGAGGLEPLQQLFGGQWTTFGGLAVRVFFVISGFLVCQSWLRRPQVLPFAAARALRIMPGLAVALLFCVLVGLAVTTLDARTFLTHPETRQFFWNNLTMRTEFFLPGVFDDNVFPRAVNGSIWSLRYEVRAYMIVLALGVLTLLRPGLIGLLGWGAAAACIWLSPGVWGMLVDNDRWVIHLCLCFVLSALVALNPFVVAWLGRIALALAITMPFALQGAWIDYHADLLLCSGALWLAHRPLPVIRSWARYGDFSYGIFIYAFPIQQLIAWTHVTDGRPYAMMVLSFTATLVCAILSWHFVERPCQTLKGPVANALQWPVDAVRRWVVGRVQGLRRSSSERAGASAATHAAAPPRDA